MTDWITDEDFKIAYVEAEKIADDFMANKFMYGEEIWDEVWINGKAFDINCYEEEMDMDSDERTTPVHVAIHPTIEHDNGLRSTDGENYERLFSYYP